MIFMNNKNFFYRIYALLYVLASITTFSLVADAPKETAEETTIAKKIMLQNLEAFPYEEDDWSSDRFSEFLMHLMSTQSNLQEGPRRRAVFLMLDRHIKKNGIKHSTVLSDSATWQDLNLFCGQKDLKHFLADKIDRSHTVFGTVQLYNMLAQPLAQLTVDDIIIMKQRKAIIEELVQNEKLLASLEEFLIEFKKQESMLVSFWTKDPFRQAAQRKYFNYASKTITDALNKNATFLNVHSFFEHTQRYVHTASTIVAAALLPLYGIGELAGWGMHKEVTEWGNHLRGTGGPSFGVAAKLLKDNKSLLAGLTIASGLASFLSIKESNDWAQDNVTLDLLMHEKMMHIAQSIKALKNIGQTVQHNNCLRKSLSSSDSYAQLFTKQRSKDLTILLHDLASDTFKEQPSILSNKGKVLVTFKLFCELKEEFEDALLALGELDAFVGLAKLYKERQSEQSHFCFAEFHNDAKPSAVLEQFWNPFVDTRNVVVNSVHLGTEGNRRNMVVTGPNAGGKSTLLKAIVISLIMAQSFGIAPAHTAIITPFDKIMTYLNVVDDIGAGNSLFKAQVLRTQNILDTVGPLPLAQKSFVLIDEMFNGTSPKEAQACAFSVAKDLDNYANNISIVATHYHLLTTLAQETKSYTNYHVSVDKSTNGALHYPFVLQYGISDQHVALDILSNQGFSGSILENAQKIMDQEKSIYVARQSC